MADTAKGGTIQPDDNEIARINAVQSHALKEKKTDMGIIGSFFGSVAEKPGNIAGFSMVVFCLMFAGVLIFGVDNTNVSITKKDELAIIGGFITLTLGFIFGRSTS